MLVKAVGLGFYQVRLSEEEQRKVVDKSMAERVPESIIIQQVIERGMIEYFPKE